MRTLKTSGRRAAKPLIRLSCAALLILSTAASVSWAAAGPGEGNDGGQASSRLRPEYRSPEVRPELPNVLVIGDSISIG